MSLRIACISPATGTSLHRVQAMERLGHTVILIDPWSWLGHSIWVSRWLYHTGGIGVGPLIDQRIVFEVAQARPDLIWVDQGPFLSKRLIKRLHALSVPIVNYTIDDPFNGRDGLRFRRYRAALPEYDSLAVVRAPNVAEAQALGARAVIHVYMSADEVAHHPRELTDAQRQRFASEVAFIGTRMPERGPFMAELIKRGVPLSIWGDRWHKAREWPQIAAHWRGPGLYQDEDYAAVIQSSRICLGLLSKGNRDLHTTRSLEIPALGGLLCAERTDEHRAMYEEGIEAVFWNDAAECAEQCRALLADEPRRKAIAAAGHARALRNGHYNERVMAEILDAAMGKGTIPAQGTSA